MDLFLYEKNEFTFDTLYNVFNVFNQFTKLIDSKILHTVYTINKCLNIRSELSLFVYTVCDMYILTVLIIIAIQFLVPSCPEKFMAFN